MTFPTNPPLPNPVAGGFRGPGPGRRLAVPLIFPFPYGAADDNGLSLYTRKPACVMPEKTLSVTVLTSPLADLPNSVNTSSGFPRVLRHALGLARYQGCDCALTLETGLLPAFRFENHPLRPQCFLARRRDRLQHSGPGRQRPRFGVKHPNAQGIGKILLVLHPHAIAAIPRFPAHCAPHARQHQPRDCPCDFPPIKR